MEKGFEGASMQEVARAAGMSVGNLYRYFPSKTAIIEALIAQHFDGIDDQLDAVAARPSPLQSLKAALRERLETRHAGDRVLSAEIGAWVAREPELAALVATRMEAITQRLARIIGLTGNLPEDVATTAAHAVSLIMHGALTAPPIDGWSEGRVTETVFWIFDRVLKDSADLA